MPNDIPTWEESEPIPTWEESQSFGADKMEEGRLEAEKQAEKAKLYGDLAYATKNLNPLRGIPNAITAFQRATGMVPPDQPDMIPENASLVNFHEVGTPPAPFGLNIGVEWAPNQNKWGEALQGVSGAAMKVAGGLTDVDMLPMLAAGAAGRVLPAAISASMLPALPDLGKEAGRVAAEYEMRLAAGEDPSIRPVAEAFADTGITAAFVAGAPVRGGLEGRRAGLTTTEQLRSQIPTGPPSVADQIRQRRAEQASQEVQRMFAPDVIRPPWESVSTADTSRSAEIPGVETPFDAAVSRAKAVLPQAAAALEGKPPEKAAPVVPPNPKTGLPDWAREAMVRAGLDPNRLLNDVDIGNPSIREAIQNDPTLTPEQKAQVLKTGSVTPVVAPVPAEVAATPQKETQVIRFEPDKSDPNKEVDFNAFVEANINQVQKALDSGKQVELVVDDGRKRVQIVGVARGMMQDVKGQRWGQLGMATHGDFIEIKGTPKPTEVAAKPAEVPPVAPAVPAANPVEDYRIQHRPNSDGPPAHDLLATDLAPRDIYDRPDLYSGDPGSIGYKESVSALRKIHGKPNAIVTVYRASPINTLNDGDWISFSKTYSKQQGMADNPSADVPVHSFKVKASDVRWAGDTLEEFGYYPAKPELTTPADVTVTPTVDAAKPALTPEERIAEIRSKLPRDRTQSDMAFADEYFKEQRIKSEAEAAEKERTRPRTDVELFLDSKTPPLRQRAKQALDVNLMHDGEMTSRKELVEKDVASGGVIVLNSNGKRRLQRPNGAYRDESQISKTAMDYADYLLKKKPATPKEVIPNAVVQKEEGQGPVTVTEPGAVEKAAPTPKQKPAAPTTTEARTGEQAIPEDTGGLEGLRQGPGAMTRRTSSQPVALEAQEGTKLSNSVAELERAERGLEPATETERQAMIPSWERSGEVLSKDPLAGQKLSREMMADRKRQLTDDEMALALRYKVILENELNDAAERTNTAKTQEEIISAEEQYGFAEREFNQFMDAIKQEVSHSGRRLRWQQALAFEDFTFATQERRLRASKGGKPLNDAERSALLKDVAEHKALLEAEKAHSLEIKAGQDKLVEETVRAAIEKLERETPKPPAIHPDILVAAERIVVALEKRASVASIRLREKLSRMSAGVDPTMILDLAEIGVGKLARMSMDLAQWSKAMLDDLGPKIEPFLKDAYEASKKLLVDDLSKVRGPRAEHIERKAKNAGNAAEQKVDVIEKIKNKIETKKLDEINPLVQKLTRLVIAEGAKDWRAVTDAVHAILKDIVPDLDYRDTMEAISGHGRFFELSKDAISKEKRDIAGQINEILKIQEVIAKQPVKPTGVEHKLPSDIQRRFIQIYNAMKRKFGTVESDSGRHLRSVLQARETWYEHRLADLKHEIATLKRTVRIKSPSPTSAKLEVLQAEYDLVKAEHESIFPRPDLTDAQKLSMLEKGAERIGKQWLDKLEKARRGVFESDIPGRKLTSTKLEEIRARAQAAKDDFKELQMADPSYQATLEARQLQSWKTRATNRLADLATRSADLESKLASGELTAADIAPKPKKAPLDVSKDSVAMKLKAGLAMVEERFAKNRYDAQQKLRTLPRKIWDGIKQTGSAMGNIMASADFSAPRQAFGYMMTVPVNFMVRPYGTTKLVATAFGRYFSATFSERRAHVIEQRRLNRPNALSGLDKISGIEYTSLDTKSFTKQEDAMHSVLDDWAKIPYKTGDTTKTILTAGPKALADVVRGSNRGFISFLNTIRAGMLDDLCRINFKDRPPTDIEVRDAGYLVNLMTGRGELHPRTSLVAGSVLWSPNLLASRLKLLSGTPMLHAGSLRTKKIVAQEYAKMLMGAYILLQVSGLFDEKKEKSKTSSDYGKIVRGNVRIDPWGGFQQNTVLKNRILTGKTTTSKGGTKSILADRKYGVAGIWYVGADFLRNKLRPDMGLIANVITRSDFLGRNTDIFTPEGRERLTKAAVPIPLAIQDVTTIMKERGFTEGMIDFILSEFGAGVSVYEQRERQK